MGKKNPTKPMDFNLHPNGEIPEKFMEKKKYRLQRKKTKTKTKKQTLNRFLGFPYPNKHTVSVHFAQAF